MLFLDMSFGGEVTKAYTRIEYEFNLLITFYNVNKLADFTGGKAVLGPNSVIA